jgi:hypothetical protein
MKIKSKLNILVIAVIDVIAVVIMVLLILNYPNERKDGIDNPTLRKVSLNDKDAVKMTFPIINNYEMANAQRRSSVSNVIQRVLEYTIKTNDEIALLAVYSDDGTILAHFKPERIGRNMFDADVELSDCMQEMFEAMENRSIYNGFKYDPLLNDNIRFIVKPLQIDNLDYHLSLLIGVCESHTR